MPGANLLARAGSTWLATDSAVCAKTKSRLVFCGASPGVIVSAPQSRVLPSIRSFSTEQGFLTPKEVKGRIYLRDEIRVDGQGASTAEHLQAVWHYVDLVTALADLERAWA